MPLVDTSQAEAAVMRAQKSLVSFVESTELHGDVKIYLVRAIGGIQVAAYGLGVAQGVNELTDHPKPGVTERAEFAHMLLANAKSEADRATSEVDKAKKALADDPFASRKVKRTR